MTNAYSIPAVRDLPAGRLDARRQHLLSEIVVPTRRAEQTRRLGGRRILVLAATALLLALGAASAFAIRAIVFGPAAQSYAPAWSPDGRKIAYVRADGGDPPSLDRSARSDLYVMNADGSAKRRLKSNVGGVPIWSPDGRKLAFTGTSGSDASSDIYVMNARGGGLRNLSHTPAWEDSPAWSPDGRRIAVVKHTDCWRCSPNSELWTMNPDGSGKRLLAFGVGIGVATWSPDGHTLVYESSYRPSPNDPKRKFLLVPRLFRVNVDGSGRRRLAYGAQPVWSPDGTKIAFIGRRGSRADLWIMNPDGSGQRRLTRTPAFGERDFAWSPDGRTIAFTAGRGNHSEIYAIDADGGGMRNLTRQPADDGGANWSPDGRKIVFTSNRRGPWEIFVMNADGSGLHNLTQLRES